MSDQELYIKFLVWLTNVKTNAVLIVCPTLYILFQLVYYTDKYNIKQNNKYSQSHWVPSPLGLLVSLNNNKYASVHENEV